MAGRPLSNVDTAWLRMEEPDNLMMITGVLVFGGPIGFDRLKDTLQRRLLCFERFRQRVVQPLLPLGTPRWENDPDFDLGYHLQRATLPPPGDQAALQDVASLLASRQLDLSRPLWQFHLIERYGEGCALVCRLHHSIGDGTALVHVLLSMTDAEPDAAQPEPLSRESRRHPRSVNWRPLRRSRAAVRTARQQTTSMVREGWNLMVHPSRGLGLAKTGARGSAALARLVLRWPDPKTIFKGELGIPKRAAWTAPFSLSDVKTVGRVMGGTVNDVLLTAVTGALRRYMLDRGETVDGVSFRAVVPVDLRPPGVVPDLGNRFGLVFLSLPVGIGDPAPRLRELKRRMDGIKDSLEAPVAFGILNAIGMAPEQIQDIVVNIFGTKGTAVMTNVIGPRERIYLAGAPLESLMFWVPQSGRLGVGVSILSYAGNVWMGVITDQGLVPDPETIIANVHDEFHALLALATEGAPRPGLQTVSEALDGALETLDELLAQGRAGSGNAGPVPSRCQAHTRTGRRCKNRPLSGSDFCRTHQPA